MITHRALFAAVLSLACLFDYSAAQPVNTHNKMLAVAHLSAQPGHITRGDVSVDIGPVDNEPYKVEIPVILINGALPGPKVVFTAGVHGGEFIGSAAILDLAKKLESDIENIEGQIVLSPVVNPPAVFKGRLANSIIDGVNMNREFPGKSDGKPTEKLAYWLFKNLISGADAYADLHSGGIDENLLDFVGYRISGEKELDDATRAMAMAVGYERVISGKMSDDGNSHNAVMREMGIPAILIETGELGDRRPSTVRTLVDALYRLLHHLKVLQELPQDVKQPTTKPLNWVWASFVKSPATGFWYPNSETKNGATVAEGNIIGYIEDPALGTKVEVIANGSGEIIYNMNGLSVEKNAEIAAIGRLQDQSIVLSSA